MVEKPFFPSPSLLTEFQVFCLRAGGEGRFQLGGFAVGIYRNLSHMIGHTAATYEDRWGLGQAWILAALCLMEGDDALISQSLIMLTSGVRLDVLTDTNLLLTTS